MSTQVFLALRTIINNVNSQKYTFDHKGHYSDYYDYVTLEQFFYNGLLNSLATDIPDTDLDILQKIANLEELDFFYKFKSDFTHKCWHCSENLTLISNGKIFSFSHKCSVSPTKYSIKIKTPSKKVVIANDLRVLFKDSIESDINISHISGILQEAKDYADVNLGYIYTGNKPLYVEKTDTSLSIKEGTNDKTDIITDLWAVCICDYDDFIQRFKLVYNHDNYSDFFGNLYIFEVEGEEVEITSYLYEDNRADLIASIK